MNRVLLLLLISFFSLPAHSQDSSGALAADTTGGIIAMDSLQAQDTAISREVSKKPAGDTMIQWHPDLQQDFAPQFKNHVYTTHPYFGFGAPGMKAFITKKEWHGKEAFFYIMAGLVLFFGLFRQAFGRYLSDLKRLFFRTSLKQKQLREQLLQTPLASLLLNLFFVICTAFYIFFLLKHYHFLPQMNQWILLLYIAAFLAAIYLVKFIWLKLAGWIFNFSEATDNYIFIVFIINKVIGIFLLPFLILLAFTSGRMYEIAYLFSVIGLAGILGYRFILTFDTVRNHIKINLFHFFLYLCAFEIIPLLLIYKVLLLIFERSS